MKTSLALLLTTMAAATTFMSCKSDKAAAPAAAPAAEIQPALTLEGSWVEPVPGMEEQTQGFTLNEDGTAVSINMATLQYQEWSASGDTLVLTGKSIGNGQTIDMTDTLLIVSVSADSLVVRQHQLTRTFHKAQ